MAAFYRWRWVAISAGVLLVSALLGGFAMRADAGTGARPGTTRVPPAAGEGAGSGDGGFVFRLHSEPVAAPEPGSTTPLRVRLRNPYDGPVVIESLTGQLLGSGERCRPTAADLIVGPHAGPPRLPLTLEPGVSVDAGTIPIHVPPSVSAECRTATYRFLITGSGRHG